MFTSLRTSLSKLPRWLQILAVLVAGAASFYLSFNVGMRERQRSADNAIIVAAKPSIAPASAAQPPASPASEAGIQANVVTTPSRLAPGILQNPFAPLNLRASMDKPVVVAVAEPKPEKKPTPKPLPVPVAPPVEVPQVVAPPTAPPLPFVVVGAIRGQGIANGKPVVFLNEKGVSLVVSQGDDIHGTYKVEKIDPNTIEFTYLPLGQRQSLSLAK